MTIVFTSNLEFSPYSEVIHESTTFKLTKVNKGWRRMITIQFDIFDLSFFFFIVMSQTISIINRSGAWNFLHASN